MYKAKVSASVYVRNSLVLLVALTYSFYALYSCGMEAVFGGTLVLVIGYLLYASIAKRFVGTPPPPLSEVGDA
ncbi:putrescine transporter [compost metagenome]